MRIILLNIAKSLRELIMSKDFLERSKQRAADFTRNRKMNFAQLLTFMMNLVNTSTQTALDRFFWLVETPQVHMTQQSFSEARQKLRPEACRELFLHTVESVYAYEVSRWHGNVNRLREINSSTSCYDEISLCAGTGYVT